MIVLFDVFIWLGVFKLLFLYWSDLKCLKIDDRHSSFMIGVVVVLFIITGRILEMLVVIFVASFLLGKLKEKASWFGLSNGDIGILVWVIPGFWLFGWTYLTLFLVMYVIGIYVISKIYKQNSGLPLTIPILVSFVIVWMANNLMLI